jgi:GTPase
MATFVDEAVIQARAGDGGDGIVAWRREAHVSKGGPAGGDGGDGGDVVFVADENAHSLLDFKYKPHLTAGSGQQGRGKGQSGSRGDDAVARVPIGTQVFDVDTGAKVADLTENGQRVVVCKGGNGGFGNQNFATPSRQAPEFAKPGLPGERRTLRLSLKLMADVGLLGFPNAGKSTFLAAVSAARPKIADYPFTTLVPQLGVVRLDDTTEYVVADVPGIIEGAAEGAGLGIRFLKHLERVRVLLHLIEVPLEYTVDAVEVEGVMVPPKLTDRYTTLRAELERFSDELAALPEIVAVSKIDLLPGDAAQHADVKALAKLLKKKGVPLRFLSAATKQGVPEMVRFLADRVQAARAPEDTGPQGFDPLRGEDVR